MKQQIAALQTTEAKSVPNPATERHYTPSQVAEMWNVTPDTVRRYFADREGVLRLEHPTLRGKRPYVSMRIPESVLASFHRENSRKWSL